MKINDHLLRFPKYLPNDLEGLMFYYPEKFPPIIAEFEKIAPKIASDPAAFRKYGDWARDELWIGFEKVKAIYEEGDHADLGFLIDVDQKLHKLYCYRFWIVNYLFPDGPIHDFIVDNLKGLIRKFVAMSDDVEEYEQKIERVQRDLLQSDYADLYLTQALEGVKVFKRLEEHPKIAKILPQVIQLIDAHTKENTAQINKYWDSVYDTIQHDNDSAQLKEALEIPLTQVVMRTSSLPLYNALTHAVEFRRENLRLASRNDQMESIINGYKEQARSELTREEYDLFDFCYDQTRNFSMYKDIMGRIDAELFPVWFKVHSDVRKTLEQQGLNIDVDQSGPNAVMKNGPTAVIHHLVWHLPDELKAIIMTADTTEFNVETL